MTHTQFIRNYKNKKILEKYKNISEGRPTQLNTLLELYNIVQTIDIRKDQLKTKCKNNNNNK